MNLRSLTARALRKAARTFADDPPLPVSLSDEYITWLRYANAGMLDPGNPYLMDYAMSRLPSQAPILEIGSFCGLSTNVLAYLARKHGRSNRLFSCDKWEFENRTAPCIGNSALTFDRYKTFVRDSYFRNVEFFGHGDRPFTIEAFSEDFFAMWREGKSTEDVFSRSVALGGPLSFCYIDGNHTYEAAKADFVNCDAFLDAGGFLLFDDSAWDEFGVHKLMPEVLATRRYELIARNPNHLFRKLPG